MKMRFFFVGAACARMFGDECQEVADTVMLDNEVHVQVDGCHAILLKTTTPCGLT